MALVLPADLIFIPKHHCQYSTNSEQSKKYRFAHGKNTAKSFWRQQNVRKLQTVAHGKYEWDGIGLSAGEGNSEII